MRKNMSSGTRVQRTITLDSKDDNDMEKQELLKMQKEANRQRETDEAKKRNLVLRFISKRVTMFKMQKYMYTYLKSVSVLPAEHLVDKFNYFYSGYNF